MTWQTGTRGIRTGQKRKHSRTVGKLRTELVQNCGGDQLAAGIFAVSVRKLAE